MEENTGETEGAETITDIQNYLASFNKEIQDGGTNANSASAPQLDPVTDGDTSAEQGTETAFFVTAPGATSAEGFQYEQGEVEFFYFLFLFVCKFNIICILIQWLKRNCDS